MGGYVMARSRATSCRNQLKHTTMPHPTASTHLVVLGQALRAARRAGLDLASGQAHRQVSDEGVLGLTRAARKGGQKEAVSGCFWEA